MSELSKQEQLLQLQKEIEEIQIKPLDINTIPLKDQLKAAKLASKELAKLNTLLRKHIKLQTQIHNESKK